MGQTPKIATVVLPWSPRDVIFYEFDTAADSGLSVSATNTDFTGNVTIEVYENGQLRTQDSDSSSCAFVSY